MAFVSKLMLYSWSVPSTVVTSLRVKTYPI